MRILPSLNCYIVALSLKGKTDIKDRVYRFCGPPSKLGLSRELCIHFCDAIHLIEGDYVLYIMKE